MDNYAIDENYASFIVEYSYTFDDIIDEYNPDYIKAIDSKFAIIYKKISDISDLSINTVGYNSFPKCYGLLDMTSIESTGTGRIRRNPNLGYRGRGTIIAFADTGIDYNNDVFKNADGTSRIIALWDQTQENDNVTTDKEFWDIDFGTVYTKDVIDEALRTEQPQDIVTETDTDGHGTIMASVAAGNESIPNDFSGIAPACDIVCVKLRQSKSYIRDYYFIQDDVVCYQEDDIMLAIKFLLKVAQVENKPIIICLGIGTNQGNHSGRSFLEEYIDIIGDRNGVVVITAAGNEGNEGHHFMGRIEADSVENDYDNVEIKVGAGERGFVMELWVDAPNVAAIGLLSPTGEYVDKIPPRINTSQKISFIFDKTTVTIDYIIVEAETGNQLIFLRFDGPSEGIWSIRVFPSSVVDGNYNLWLPMERFISSETYFIRPEPNITLCAPSNCIYGITASGYNHRTGGIYIETSRGFTSDNRIQPVIAAPCVLIYVSAPGNVFTNASGTSIAAAHTAGVVALLFEWAITDNNYRDMDSLVVKKFLIRGAERKRGTVYPNEGFGYGTLDIYNTFESLRIRV